LAGPKLFVITEFDCILKKKLGSSEALLWIGSSNGKVPPKAIEIVDDFGRNSCFCKVTENDTVWNALKKKSKPLEKSD